MEVKKSFVLASETETLPQNVKTCLISDSNSSSPFNNKCQSLVPPFLHQEDPFVTIILGFFWFILKMESVAITLS